MAERFRLQMADVVPVASALGRALPKDTDPEDALAAVGLAGKADFRGGRAPSRWQAALEAAIDANDGSLAGLLDWVVKSTGRRTHEELKEALDESAKAALRRIVRKSHPELDDQVETLMAAGTMDEMRTAASQLRRTSLAIRSLLSDAALGAQVLVAGPPFSDPYRMRMETADLAIDVVTALDYLLANLDAPETRAREPFSLSETVDRLPAADGDSNDRRLRRVLDARAAAVRLASRMFTTVRRDFVI